MRKIVPIILCLILVVSGCAPAIESDSPSQSVQDGPIRLTDLGVVDLHTEEQQGYLDDEYLFITAKGGEEKSHPKAVVLQWESDLPQESEFTVSLSESPDMADSKVYTQKNKSLYVYNLKTATTYYWTVAVGDVISDVASFSTADCQPRNIYCDGVTNMRDLGGWKTTDGSQVKQGLLYRSGCWAKPQTDPVITEEGKATLKELGIVTELDLRVEAVGLVSESVVEGISYIQCPMVSDGSYFSNNRDSVVKIFEVLANEATIPL